MEFGINVGVFKPGLLIKVGGSHIALGREARGHGFLTLGPLHLHLARGEVCIEWRGRCIFDAGPTPYRPKNGARWEAVRVSPEKVAGYTLGWGWDFFPCGGRVGAAA